MSNTPSDSDYLILPLSSNPLWNDLIPILQDDSNTICPILYTSNFIDAMNYFRSIIFKAEYSYRALVLTSYIIDLNSANYTAWHYRRECLFHLNSNLLNELTWTSNLCNTTPKNYQLWYHRRVIVQRLNNIGNELEHTAEILQNDGKNYHVWSHRQWVVNHFNCYNNELAFIELLLNIDIRNNSAWNHRHLVISKTTGYTTDIIKFELDYTLEKLSKVQGNESAWTYLIGVLRLADELLLKDILERVKLILPTETIMKSSVDENEVVYSNARVYTLSALSQICEIIKSAEAKVYFESLIKEDHIRTKYWEYKLNSYVM